VLFDWLSAPQIKRVVFTGNFLRRNMIALQTVSYSLAKWSELASSRDPSVPLMEALFLKHEGYFGAVGAFLKNRSNAAGSWVLIAL
jgi:type II pantothenate kinase